MTHVVLDVISDVVCPWCWLGKRRLEAALADAPGLRVEVRLRPYELDPAVPAEGLDYRAYMRAKFGDGETGGRFKAMRRALEEAAPGAGVTFRFDEIAMRPNTLNAHRVIRWARGQGKAGEAAEALFRAYFDELRDIGDAGVLAEVAGAAGLDRALVAELLASDRDVAAVREEEAFFVNIGVTGVPTFIANGRYAVAGAADPEVLGELLAKSAEAGPPSAFA